MGWLDDFGQGFAQGFVPSYTNRMAQQQRQEDALALKYMDKFSTVKAKNDKAAKLRKAQLSKARSIVNNIPQIESENKAAMISYTTDLIVNGGMTNEKNIKDAVENAYKTNSFETSGFKTDFSYTPDPMPVMPTRTGGVDTSGMSTMGKFLAESLGVSSTASNANISSTVKKEQIDNTDNIQKTKQPSVEKVEVKDVEAEEEKVSGVVTQSFKPLKRPFDSMEQGDLEATQAIMDEQIGDAENFPGRITTTNDPLPRPKIELSNAEQEIKRSTFTPPDTNYTSWTNYRSELINRKTDPSFMTDGEFDYGKRNYGKAFADSYKDMGEKLFDEYLEENPKSFTSIEDFMSLDLEQVGMVYDLHKKDFIETGVVSENQNWDTPLTKNQMKKLYNLPEENEDQKVIKKRLKNIALSLEMQHLKKNNVEIDGILNPKNFPTNISLENIREKLILVEGMFEGNRKALDNSKHYKNIKNLISEGVFKTEKEINVTTNQNKDPFYNISIEAISDLPNTNANRELLQQKIDLAEANINNTSSKYDDKTVVSVLKTISTAKNKLIAMEKTAPLEPDIDPYPEFSKQTIISFAGEDGLTKAKSMLLAINKQLETPDLISGKSKILKERKELLTDKIKLFTTTKKSISSILTDPNGKTLTREGMLVTLESKKQELKLIENAVSQTYTSRQKIKFTKKEIDLLTNTIKVLGQNEGTFESVKVAKLDAEGTLVMQPEAYTFNGLHYRDGSGTLISEEIAKTLIQIETSEFNKFKTNDVTQTSELIERSNNNVALFSNIADAYYIIETNENVTNPFTNTITGLKDALIGGADAVNKIFKFDPTQKGDGQSRTIEQASSVIERSEKFSAGQKALMVKTLSIVYGLAGARGSTGMALSDREMANIMKTVIVEGNPERAKAILRGHVQEAFRNYEAQRNSTEVSLKQAGYQFNATPFYKKDSKTHFMEVFQGAEGTHGNALQYFDEMLTGSTVDLSSLESNQNNTRTLPETIEINNDIATWVNNMEDPSEMLEMYKDMLVDVQNGNTESKTMFINLMKRTQGFPVDEGVNYEAPLFEFLESTLQEINKLRETN